VSDLDGRIALVTGASRGIGAAIAERFAAVGAVVAISARTVDTPHPILSGTLEETLARIDAVGGRAIVVPADLSHHEDRTRLVAEVQEELGPIDVLVNNAAVTYFEPLVDFQERHYDLMFEVQVKAAVHLAQLVIPGMKANGRGWILNISSGAARHPDPVAATREGRPVRGLGGTVYGMCKAALERLSSGLAAELYDAGVAVNALSPARVVPTPGTLHHHLVREDTPAELVEQPEVMAEAALALCSGDPKVLTGRVTYSQPLLDELGIPVPGAAG